MTALSLTRARPFNACTAFARQAFELPFLLDDLSRLHDWLRHGGWDSWHRAASAASSSALSAPEHAWNSQFTLAARAFFYGFVATYIRIKARAPDSVALGYVVDGRFTVVLALLALALLPWVLADFAHAGAGAGANAAEAARRCQTAADAAESVKGSNEGHAVKRRAAGNGVVVDGDARRARCGSTLGASAQSSRSACRASAAAKSASSTATGSVLQRNVASACRHALLTFRTWRRGWIAVGSVCAFIAAASAAALAVQVAFFEHGHPDGAGAKRLVVAVLCVYTQAACGALLLELAVLHEPRAMPALRLVHKARDYALCALLIAPLLLLGLLRVPAHMHKALIFQQSFVDNFRLVHASAFALVVAVVALALVGCIV
eukprot:6200433-Pleurochrysis_carterae.AAC.3